MSWKELQDSCPKDHSKYGKHIKFYEIRIIHVSLSEVELQAHFQCLWCGKALTRPFKMLYRSNITDYEVDAERTFEMYKLEEVQR